MSDPNILYGGDFLKSSELNYPSIGALIIDKLTKGNRGKIYFNGATNEGLSRLEILKKSILIAKTLHNLGVCQNDMVSIVSDNRHDYIAITFGVLLINAILAPINFSYTEREIRHALDLSKPKIIFVSSAAAKTVTAVCENLSFVQKIVHIDKNVEKGSKYLSFDDFLKMQTGSFNVYEHVKKAINLRAQSAVIFLSSGTTGSPKGVEITQHNIITTIRTAFEGIEDTKKIVKEMRTLSVAPSSHVMGFFSTMHALLSPESFYVFLPKFELKIYLSCIEKYKITMLSAAPPMLVVLSKTPLLNQFDLSSLKLIFTGAAPLSKEVEDHVKARWKNKLEIIQTYGMSEMTYAALMTFWPIKPGAAGKILRGDYVKVIDSKGKSLPANKVGELCFKGNRIMKGYLNNPKATAETIDKDGWLHTGDLGYFDDDKEFFIVDRLKELIKYKAFQVAPAELEGLLLSNPKIRDCGVIGIPDEIAGELPFGFVVKQPGAEITEDEVKNFVKQNASNAKWLRGGVKFIDEIPKNPSGKILRRELRELFKSSKSKL